MLILPPILLDAARADACQLYEAYVAREQIIARLYRNQDSFEEKNQRIIDDTVQAFDEREEAHDNLTQQINVREPYDRERSLLFPNEGCELSRLNTKKDQLPSHIWLNVQKRQLLAKNFRNHLSEQLRDLHRLEKVITTIETVGPGYSSEEKNQIQRYIASRTDELVETMLRLRYEDPNITTAMLLSPSKSDISIKDKEALKETLKETLKERIKEKNEELDQQEKKYEDLLRTLYAQKLEIEQLLAQWPVDEKTLRTFREKYTTDKRLNSMTPGAENPPCMVDHLINKPELNGKFCLYKDYWDNQTYKSFIDSLWQCVDQAIRLGVYPRLNECRRGVALASEYQNIRFEQADEANGSMGQGVRVAYPQETPVSLPPTPRHLFFRDTFDHNRRLVSCNTQKEYELHKKLDETGSNFDLATIAFIEKPQTTFVQGERDPSIIWVEYHPDAIKDAAVQAAYKELAKNLYCLNSLLKIRKNIKFWQLGTFKDPFTALIILLMNDLNLAITGNIAQDKQAVAQVNQVLELILKNNALQNEIINYQETGALSTALGYFFTVAVIVTAIVFMITALFTFLIPLAGAAVVGFAIYQGYKYFQCNAQARTVATDWHNMILKMPANTTPDGGAANKPVLHGFNRRIAQLSSNKANASTQDPGAVAQTTLAPGSGVIN